MNKIVLIDKKQNGECDDICAFDTNNPIQNRWRFFFTAIATVLRFLRINGVLLIYFAALLKLFVYSQVADSYFTY